MLCGIAFFDEEEDPYNHLEGETSDEEVQETQNDLDEEMALKTAEHDKADTSKTDIEGPTANDVEMTEARTTWQRQSDMLRQISTQLLFISIK